MNVAQMRAMQRQLESEGFAHTSTVMAGDSSASGMWFAHADGRTARIFKGAIERFAAPTQEGGAR